MGELKYNKRQKDCLWKQRTHYRLENGRLFISRMKFATLLMPSSLSDFNYVLTCV